MLTFFTVTLGVVFFALPVAFAELGNSQNARRRAKKGGCQ